MSSTQENKIVADSGDDGGLPPINKYSSAKTAGGVIGYSHAHFKADAFIHILSYEASVLL
jgi:hypothetical protein